ncbi:alpha/beta fold hydrolase [Streptomyces sp. DSM 44915]|uniref:Alpha/beta fold hydrolase n=1 Tax=Streptomyces chisholmiae TaxID=3075540 RepID=A0ABU2JMN2_9ACTN|nr:alpha/beta fold hydrolase [Streptomyces sp. DSM 44915]MDT0266251.1 alpha/beta fold hydrolase [Streptomyces sp. DSM 44915]
MTSTSHLAHDVAGDGPALLLLHSTVCDRRMWDPQWRILIDAGFRVTRCDFRGHGDSPAADRPYRDAEDVRDLLNALGVDRTAVVGSSFGGGVALEVAARWPDRVGALAVLNAAPPLTRPTPALTAFQAREAELIAADAVAEAVELNVATWLGPEADGNTRAMVRLMQRHSLDVRLAAEKFARPSAEYRLARIGAPTLAVSGGHDLPEFRSTAAELPRLLPRARHQELPWAGHLPSLERPAEVARLLVDFLREPA